MQNLSSYATIQPAAIRPLANRSDDRLIMGAAFADVDQCHCHGDHVFYQNDGITWLLFDEDGLDGPRLSDRRRLCRAAAIRAVLQYAMPRLDFTGATEAADMPLRLLDSARRRPVDPRCWMPRAHLGVRFEAACRLYARAVTCSSLAELDARTASRTCPQSAPNGSHFAQAFSAALAEGLPLITPCEVRYLGSTPLGDGTRQRRGHDLTSHRFTCDGSHREYAVHAPINAHITARAGESLPAGGQWCRAVAKESDCSSSRLTDIEVLRQAWLHSRSVELTSHPGLVFFPANLIATMAIHLDPVELIWDFSHAESFVDTGIDAVIFPPFDVQALHDGRLTLPGEVDFCTGTTEAQKSCMLMAS
jgi:hypothetical protein